MLDRRAVRLPYHALTHTNLPHSESGIVTFSIYKSTRPTRFEVRIDLGMISTKTAPSVHVGGDPAGIERDRVALWRTTSTATTTAAQAAPVIPIPIGRVYAFDTLVLIIVKLIEGSSFPC